MAILYDLFLFIILHCALAGKYSVYGNIRKIMFCEYFIDFHIGSEAKHRWDTCEIIIWSRKILTLIEQQGHGWVQEQKIYLWKFF